jgi:hypothetical protein
VKCFLRRLEFKHDLYITNSQMAFDLCDGTHSDWKERFPGVSADFQTYLSSRRAAVSWVRS